MKWLAMACVTVWSGVSFAQRCPSYTFSSPSNTGRCAIEAVNGTNPTVAEWNDVFALVAQGPMGWGSSGPTAQSIMEGCNNPMPETQVPARFPCELLKAIAMQESTWRQFCVPSSPADQLGGPSRTIISFDCGYGVGQVTSGMHIGEAPGFDRARVAADPVYSMATGARILAEKWRVARCVGDRRPLILEHWYIATWAYNGLSFTNSPNNPNYSTTRGVYRPSVGGAAPYQEKIFGWLEFPPSASHWSSVGLAYPALVDVGDAGRPNALPDPTCASPTSCAATRALHTSACFSGGDAGFEPDGGDFDAGVSDGGLDAGVLDAGTDAGQMVFDAGSDAGQVDPSPIFIDVLPQTLGPQAGCGCSSGFAGLGIMNVVLAAFIRRRRNP